MKGLKKDAYHSFIFIFFYYKMQSNLNDASGAVELPTQLDTELLDVPPLTTAAQLEGDIFRDPLFSCFASQMEYIAMGEALEAYLAGLGGIDDVEDMLDDEGFLQLLSKQEVSVPPTFVILEIGQQHPDWLQF
jgi:hypothetical protein